MRQFCNLLTRVRFSDEAPQFLVLVCTISQLKLSYSKVKGESPAPKVARKPIGSMMFKKQIEKWKLKKDKDTRSRIAHLMTKFHSDVRRKDLVFDLVLSAGYSIEELEEFSNELGRHAHALERKMK